MPNIDLGMGYTFIVPDKGEPYIINCHGEEMASIMLTGTAVAKAVYAAMKQEAEINIATLKGELQLVENLAKLSGGIDGV
jgi:diadenosine tetraphosphate (Ap4A) HIT family hydrolase